jgi:tRNA G46 methylase TrmB
MTQAIPDVLKSHKFHRVPASVASVTSVADTLEVDGHVTVATDATHYFTRHGNNGNKPTDPCATCGSTDWWRRDGDWLCGHCHPEALG